ncbi:MAG: hypothetical protein IPK16_13915 [Anaerolineales bacterium]|nr:hypothetical protein [Anaerolineales bacterium]
MLEKSGFGSIEKRRTWSKLVLGFADHQLLLANHITIPENIDFTQIQTNLLILFCYFYHYSREYAVLSSKPDEFVLPGKTNITWSLFEPGVISSFVAPLRRLSTFGRFDERELSQFFRLSGNTLSSLRWILHPIYDFWFQPLNKFVLEINKDRVSLPRKEQTPPQTAIRSLKLLLFLKVGKPTLAPYLQLPQVNDAETIDKPRTRLLQAADSDTTDTNHWRELYYEKVLEVQKLSQQLIRKSDNVSDLDILTVYEELLRTHGDFQVLFTGLLPHRGPKTNMRKWRTVERTMLNLRSLFIQRGFIALVKPMTL